MKLVKLLILVLVCNVVSAQCLNSITDFITKDSVEFIFRLGVSIEDQLSGKKLSKFDNYKDKKRVESRFPLSCSILKFYLDSADIINKDEIRVIYYSHNQNIRKINPHITYSHCLLDYGETILKKYPKLDDCSDKTIKYGKLRCIESNKFILEFLNANCGYEFSLVLTYHQENELLNLYLEEMIDKRITKNKNIEFNEIIGFRPIFYLSTKKIFKLK